MGAMAVLWSFLGVLKHLLAPPLRCPCLLPLKKILFLGVPAATLGGTGTPWHTRGYAPAQNYRESGDGCNTFCISFSFSEIICIRKPSF